MLTTNDIKENTYSATYTKGRNLQLIGYVRDMRYQIYCVDGITTVDVEAEVRGSHNNWYHVAITVDEEFGDIQQYKCECEAFYNYEGLCKHCVAVLLEYLAKRSKFDIMESQWKNARAGREKKENYGTTVGMLNMLKKYGQQKSSTFLLPEKMRGQVELTPYFENTYGASQVEFKIGTEQKYVLKNISSFIESVDKAEKVRYGKKLDFYHNIEAFTPRAQKIIHFLQEQCNDKKRLMANYRYYAYGENAYVRSMELDEVGLERFLMTMQGEKFEGVIGYQAQNVWFVSMEEKQPKLMLAGDENGITLQLEDYLCLKGNSRYFFCQEGTIYPGSQKMRREMRDFVDFMERQEDRSCYVAKEELPVFCRDMLPVIRRNFEVITEKFEEQLYLPEKPEFELYLDKLEGDYIAGKLLAVYGGSKYNVMDAQQVNENRNIEEELLMRQKVEEYFNAYEPKERLMVLENDNDLLYEFLTIGVRAISEYATIYTSDAFRSLKVVSSPSVSIGVSLKSDLLELEIQSGEMPMDQLAYILSHYDRRKKFIRMKSGEFLNVDEDGIRVLSELKQDLHLTEAKIRTGNILIPKYRAMYLDATLKNQQALAVDKNKEFKSMVRNMKTIEDSDFEVPENLKGVLREYQRKGFLWLKTLHQNGFGGILADDMGLGKTLQVISFLESEQEELAQSGEQGHPALIVCPASLVYNWKKEIERFAPSLAVVIVSGTAGERKKILEQTKSDAVIVTSYDLLKRDISIYEKMIFATQVIDEAQYIKNARTQAAKAVKQISAGFKIALTGTPIENRLSELWSIFDYLMPGFLFSYQDFRERIEIPIIQNQDAQEMEHLQRMIRPFVLRRLKREVLKDLPEKLEENVYARLEGEQLKLYDAHVQRMKLILNKQVDEQEFNRDRFRLLAELTKLRQLCCDPSLVFENYNSEQAKMDMCMELIQNAVGGGHKILLFSQFTTMLEHLQKRLSAEDISFYTLTGSVNKEKRMQLVEAFNQDETSVFCISLKAGGTGLNLTAADIVIHFDPWWNVAVQNQATDRAHRIGQTNVVTVYKLVTQGTIEEKIIEMQEKKQELAEQVLEGEGMDSATFSREELLALLQ